MLAIVALVSGKYFGWHWLDPWRAAEPSLSWASAPEPRLPSASRGRTQEQRLADVEAAEEMSHLVDQCAAGELVPVGAPDDGPVSQRKGDARCEGNRVPLGVARQERHGRRGTVTCEPDHHLGVGEHALAAVEALGEAGLRDKVKVMIGGAPINDNVAREYGADGYAADASAAVTLARNLAGVTA